jgi:hypothetical protein
MAMKRQSLPSVQTLFSNVSIQGTEMQGFSIASNIYLQQTKSEIAHYTTRWAFVAHNHKCTSGKHGCSPDAFGPLVRVVQPGQHNRD